MPTTDTTAFKPAPGSKAGRICSWFASNRRQVLTEQDIGEMFSVPVSRVTETLAECVTHGLLKRELDFERDANYSAGPALPGLMGSAHVAGPALTRPSGEVASAPKARKARSPAPALPDPASLVVRKGVPMPASITGRSPYAATFEAMEVGSSFLCSPAAVKGMHTRANSWGKANGGRKFSSRVLSDTEAGIWRIA